MGGANVWDASHGGRPGSGDGLMLLWLVRRFSTEITDRDRYFHGIPAGYRLLIYDPCLRHSYYAPNPRYILLRILESTASWLTSIAVRHLRFCYWAVIDSDGLFGYGDVKPETQEDLDAYIRKQRDVGWLAGAKTGWRAAGLVLDSLMPRRMD